MCECNFVVEGGEKKAIHEKDVCNLYTNFR